MYFQQFFEKKLAQYSYLIGCQASGEAIVIDPLRDIDQYLKAASSENLKITKAADTHIHADYVSGLREFAEHGVKVYASDEGGDDWKYEWLINSRYNCDLLKDSDEIHVGNIRLRAWHTPGHTPEHLSYFITDGASADNPLGLATGDFVFVGDVGRPDLLESAAGEAGVMVPSAKKLYQSINKFREVPEFLQVWPGHGSGSACGKALGSVPGSTVGYELRFNNSIRAAESEQNFVDYILDGQPEPPYYFARMKRVNKAGPGVLGKLPVPGYLTVSEIVKNLENEDAVVLDTREMKSFMQSHLRGSLCTPFNKQFNTVAGCYVEENQNIYLLIEESRLEEAVRDLIRVGLDNIKGYITPHDLEVYSENGGSLDSIEGISFEELDRKSDEYTILDVRKSSEYNEAHLPETINIAHTRLFPQSVELPRNKPLAVHCQAGGRSGYASAFLKLKGFDVTWVYDQFTNAVKTTTGS